MLYCLRFLVIFLSILLPSVAYCFPFDPIRSDQSLQYLGALFGPQVGIVPLANIPANPVVVNMFQILNATILVMGILSLIYIGVFSTIQTSGEGEGMGRRWSSPTAVLRSVIGLMLMFPTPGAGYSIVQVLVMYVVSQGIGIANQIYGMVLDQIAQGVGLSSGIKADTTKLKNSAENLANSMLNAVVCAETLRVLSQPAPSTPPADWPLIMSSFVSDSGSAIKAYSAYSGETDSGNSAEVSGTFNIGVKNDSTYGQICGSFAVNGKVKTSDWPSEFRNSANNLSKAREIFDAKQLALLQMYQLLKPLGNKIARRNLQPVDNAGNFMPSNENQPKPTGYADGAKDAYVDALVQMYKPKKPEGLVQQVVNQGKSFGWSSAGSFYYLLTQSGEQSLFPSAEVGPTPSDIPAATPQGSPSLGVLGDYIEASEATYLGNRLRDAALYMAFDNPDVAESISLSGAISGDGEKLLKTTTSKMQDSVKDFQSWISNEQDDYLSGIASLGAGIMLVAEIIILLTIGIALILAIVAGICAAKLPTYLTFTTAVLGLWPMIVAFVGMFWSVGAMMAIYVPMIPYMIFSMALLGWIILVVEAMIAAPLMALALCTPTGEKLGRAGAGLYILLGLFLRPALMVFGFTMSVILLKVIINLIHFGMAEVYSTIDALGSMFSPIVALFMYNAFIIAVVNNVFSLIYHVPDRVLVWIGGQAEQTQADLSEVKQGFEATAQEAGKAVTAAGVEAAQSGVKSIKKMTKEDDDKAKKAIKGEDSDDSSGDDDDDDDGGDTLSAVTKTAATAAVAATGLAASGDGSGVAADTGDKAKSFKDMSGEERSAFFEEKSDQLSKAREEADEELKQVSKEKGPESEEAQEAWNKAAQLRELQSGLAALQSELSKIDEKMEELADDVDDKGKWKEWAEDVGGFFDKWAATIAGVESSDDDDDKKDNEDKKDKKSGKGTLDKVSGKGKGKGDTGSATSSTSTDTTASSTTTSDTTAPKMDAATVQRMYNGFKGIMSSKPKSD